MSTRPLLDSRRRNPPNIPETDSFTVRPGASPGGTPFPRPTFDDLIAVRRDFAQDVDDPRRKENLLSALDGSTNPLVAFRSAVVQLGLDEEWGRHLYEALRKRLIHWAHENNVQPSESWFLGGVNRHGEGDTAQAVLSRFAQYMTEDEARSVLVPFRAVEAMYREISSRR